MLIHDYLAMFVASFSSVCLLGLQSKNVQSSRIFAAVVTSLCISASQFVFIRYSATGSPLAMLVMTSGGALGIATSIIIHDKFFKKKK